MFGFTDATFKAGSISSGVNVAGNEIPNTPDYTATFGTQLSRAVRADATVYGRAEVTFYGAFQYDDLNRAGQDSYSLTNFRARHPSADICSRKAGSGTRSTRDIFRSLSRSIRSLRDPGSLARAARRARSASARAFAFKRDEVKEIS